MIPSATSQPVATSGIGVIPEGVDIAPERARPGDAILLSGALAVHGITIMSVREGLEFETTIESDCASLIDPVLGLLDAGLRARGAQEVAAVLSAGAERARAEAAPFLEEVRRAAGIRPLA